MKNTSVDNSATLYELSKKVNIDGNDYIVESYGPDTDGNWYKIYKSGLLVQGGQTRAGGSTNFIKPYSGNPFNVLFTLLYNESAYPIDVNALSETAFTAHRHTGGNPLVFWMAMGQGA